VRLKQCNFLFTLTKSKGKICANLSTTWLRFAPDSNRFSESCFNATTRDAAVTTLGRSSTKKVSVAHKVISFSVMTLKLEWIKFQKMSKNMSSKKHYLMSSAHDDFNKGNKLLFEEQLLLGLINSSTKWWMKSYEVTAVRSHFSLVRMRNSIVYE